MMMTMLIDIVFNNLYRIDFQEHQFRHITSGSVRPDKNHFTDEWFYRSNISRVQWTRPCVYIRWCYASTKQPRPGYFNQKKQTIQTALKHSASVATQITSSR